MKNKNKILLTAAALAVTAGIALSATQVSAEGGYGNGPMSNLVQILAEKFNLNQEEVQAVFDEQHALREQERESAFEDRLSDLVASGEITEEQRQLIIAKHQEMEELRETHRESYMNLSQEERQAAMDAHHAELEQWAEDNGIDMQYLMFGRGMGSGPRGGFGKMSQGN